MKLVQASNDPDKILTTPTREIENNDEDLVREIEMKLKVAIRLNVDKRGNYTLVGLAANQIGIDASMCICLIKDGDKHRWVTMVNPKVTDTSVVRETEVEGCGSLREPEELQYEVTRPRDVTVVFRDVTGQKMGIKLTGFDARVTQHEIDHLNGILISDHGTLVVPS